MVARRRERKGKREKKERKKKNKKRKGKVERNKLKTKMQSEGSLGLQSISEHLKSLCI